MRYFRIEYNYELEYISTPVIIPAYPQYRMMDKGYKSKKHSKLIVR